MAISVHQRPVHHWSEEEFLAARDAAPFGERWELVDGEVLVTPAPNWTHQAFLAQIVRMLDPYVQIHKVGRLLFAPVDVRLDAGTITQPDVLLVPNGHLRVREDEVRKLILAIECLSPSSSRHDRVVKRPHYQKAAVSEYWIIDPFAEVFERWQPKDERPAILDESLVWHPDGAPEPFQLDIRGFFHTVLRTDD